MKTTYPPTVTRRRSGVGSASIALVAFAALILMAVVGLTGYFRLGSDTAALRESVMRPSTGNWHKRIALHFGWMTTSLVRWGAHWAKLDPEPRAAFETLRAAEFGVYRLGPESTLLPTAPALARADQVMSRRGWERVVGVCQARQLVAVYLPRRGLSLRNLRCCVLVLSGRDLVVASARGNVGPLLALAEKRFPDKLDLNPAAKLGWPL